MNPTYRETVERLFGLHRFGIRLGLENIDRLLGLAGRPRPGKRIVLVGGTNGKGSVCAMLAAIGRRAGLKVGLYTSPHLVSFTERIQIDGERIAPDRVTAIVNELQEKLAPFRKPEEQITYFEMVTALAAVHFAENAVDLAVMEVGMGGRLDATNALPRDLVVLTDLAMDHEQYLGTSLADIVREKTALFRPGIPAVAAGGIADAAERVTADAERVGAPLALLDRDFRYRENGAGFDFTNRERHFPSLPLPLAGGHQLRNAAVAVQAALTMGFTEEVVREGLRAAVWPGRLERFAGSPEWLLDSAHNPAGAQALAASLEPRSPTVWLFAAMGDKDVAGIIAALAPKVEAAVCTEVNWPRAMPAAKLAEKVRAHLADVEVAADPDRAMERAALKAGAEGRVLTAGSIFLVGHVRGRLTGETGP